MSSLSVAADKTVLSALDYKQRKRRWSVEIQPVRGKLAAGNSLPGEMRQAHDLASRAIQEFLAGA